MENKPCLYIIIYIKKWIHYKGNRKTLVSTPDKLLDDYVMQYLHIIGKFTQQNSLPHSAHRYRLQATE